MDDVVLQKNLGHFVRAILQANADGRLESMEGHAGIARTTLPEEEWESHIHDGSRSYSFRISKFKDLPARIAADQERRRT